MKKILLPIGAVVLAITGTALAVNFNTSLRRIPLTYSEPAEEYEGSGNILIESPGNSVDYILKPTATNIGNGPFTWCQVSVGSGYSAKNFNPLAFQSNEDGDDISVSVIVGCADSAGAALLTLYFDNGTTPGEWDTSDQWADEMIVFDD